MLAKRRNYDVLKSFEVIFYVLAGLELLAALAVVFMVSEGQWGLFGLFLTTAVMFAVMAQLIVVILNVANDTEEIATIQREHTIAIRRHMETQTNLLAAMAQQGGVDKGVLNSILMDVNLSIPE